MFPLWFSSVCGFRGEKKQNRGQLLAVLAALSRRWKAQNDLLSGEESSRSNTQEGRVVPTFPKARSGVCRARFVKLQPCWGCQGSYSWHWASHPSAIVSYVFRIAEFITDKENRLLKRVSEVGSQLGLQQRGKAQGHSWSTGRLQGAQPTEWPQSGRSRKLVKCPCKRQKGLWPFSPVGSKQMWQLMKRTSSSCTGICVQKCWQIRNKFDGSSNRYAELLGCTKYGLLLGQAGLGSWLARSFPAWVLPPGAPSCCYPHQPETLCPAHRRDLTFEQTCAKVVILGGDPVKACSFSSFALSFGWKLADSCAAKEPGRRIRTNFWKLKFQISSAPELPSFQFPRCWSVKVSLGKSRGSVQPSASRPSPSPALSPAGFIWGASGWRLAGSFHQQGHPYLILSAWQWDPAEHAAWQCINHQVLQDGPGWGDGGDMTCCSASGGVQEERGRAEQRWSCGGGSDLRACWRLGELHGWVL